MSDMYLHMDGHGPARVRNYQEASDLYSERRDLSGEGASTFNDGQICNAKGDRIARVSYNGRIWGIDDWKPGREPLWDNRKQKAI